MIYPFQRKYEHFTGCAIRPEGWLRRQLQVQAEGLCGHLDLVWPDVRDSAWIGGDREGWERVPYWLDGFIPLAYLLQDQALMARAQRYIDAILDSQREDGWICPCKDDERAGYDTWAVLLIAKVLMVYGECSGDPRAEEAVYKALFNLKEHLRSHTLFNWGQSRWFEGILPLEWLYQKRPESWMPDLAVTLRTQGLDWETLFTCWRDEKPRREWSYQTHIVNLAMALKSEALFSGISGKDPNAFAHRMLETLQRYHGSVIGHIQGDECLAGRSPIRGTELCAIVEDMYSCEVLAEITGDPFWQDRCEVLAFNSLPATNSQDMWTHQYLQLVNQIACTVQEEPVVYGTNSAESNVFGLEPNYGCCTANFNQGWPKFALSAFLKAPDGILSSLLVPASLMTDVNGVPVKITLDTCYPFDGALHYTVECEKEVEFALGIRIPSFAAKAEVEGKEVPVGEIHWIRRKWCGTAAIDAELIFEAEFVRTDEELFALRRGPLFYALAIEEERRMREYCQNGVERKFPYCDYDILPASPWGYAFGDGEIEVIEQGISDYPFSRKDPPIVLRMKMAPIDWGTLPGQSYVAAPVPSNRTGGAYEIKTLQPYGCTTLRMTVMPKV